MSSRNIAPQVATKRGRVAALASHGATPERIEEARAALRVAKAEDYIQKLLKQTPPLTDAERAHLSRLLAEPERAG